MGAYPGVGACPGHYGMVVRFSQVAANSMQLRMLFVIILDLDVQETVHSL